jgi:hypothetical protein
MRYDATEIAQAVSKALYHRTTVRVAPEHQAYGGDYVSAKQSLLN